MNARRVTISMLLMIAAILAIIAFQVYWMYKNFKEEESTLKIRTNAIFRNLAQNLQSETINDEMTSSFGSDANITQRENTQPGKQDAAHQREPAFDLGSYRGNLTVTAAADEALKRKKEQLQVVGSINGDSAQEFIMYRRRNKDGSIIQMLQSVELLKDSVDATELAKRFRASLDKESMNVEFTIFRDSVSKQLPGKSIDPTLSNEVMLGYKKSYFLRYELGHTMVYITGRLSSQVVLSLLLIGLTVFSFVILYRNLIRQRKLAHMKNELISNITHELKTPIATVGVAIEALRNFHAMDDKRRTVEYLDISNNELQRLSLLVDKVLRLSMFEKHHIELSFETFNLAALAEEIIASMRLQFQQCEASVRLVAEGNDFIVSADRMHITSVIFNLLDNALKYSKSSPDITVNIKRNQQNFELSVSDKGIGIAHEYRKKVFEKFFRVPSGNIHDVKGYGLGLSYVMYVVTKHQGKIELISEPGQGSTFIIQLPHRS